MLDEIIEASKNKDSGTPKKLQTEELISLLEEFTKKCDAEKIQIEDRLQRESNGAKVKVNYFIITEYDEEKEATGRFFVAYIREPHILNSVRALDMMYANKIHEAGYFLFDTCVLKESSPEVHQDKYKLGLLPGIALLVDTQAPELKKN